MMAVVIQVDMRKLGKFERQLSSRMGPALSAAIARAAIEIQADARSLALREKIYDRGRFYSGLRVVTKGQYGITAYNTAKHSIFVEGGRRPGARMPPKAAILAWVLRHGMPASAWWPVARKIAQRGIKPRKVLTQPTFQKRARATLNRHVREALTKAVRSSR